MRLDVFSKHNIIQKNKKSFGDNNMILKRNINIYMEKIKNDEISISETAKKLNCSRQWTYELYNRYINNEDLKKQKSYLTIFRFNYLNYTNNYRMNLTGFIIRSLWKY